MEFYLIGILEAALATIAQTMYWSCWKQKKFTWQAARQWKTHIRMLSACFLLQWWCLWGLTYAALQTGINSGYYRRMALLPFLCLVAMTDYSEKVIPNRVLLAALAVRILLLVVDIAREPSLVLEQLLYMGSGAVLMACVMFVCSIVTRKSMGAGDIKLFIVIGAYCGANSAVNILLISILLLSAISLVAILLKKATLKSCVPLAPPVFAGFWLYYMTDLLE